jgi:hypothetical protein
MIKRRIRINSRERKKDTMLEKAKHLGADQRMIDGALNIFKFEGLNGMNTHFANNMTKYK